MMSDRGRPANEPHLFELPDLGSMGESDQTREIYAWAGLALYQANVLENGLVNFMVLLDCRWLIQPVAGEIVDALYDKALRKTLGQALKAVTQQSLSTPPLDFSVLEGALQDRNFLAHSFFREHAADVFSQIGPQLRLEQLRKMCVGFNAADRAISITYEDLLNQTGISPSQITAEYEELLRNARSRN